MFFADAPVRHVRVSEIGDFVTEAANPDNVRRVANVTVHMPSSVLREGLVLMDTPGVGSLARAGTQASYAYLPRCDHGVLLVDASGAITDEDVRLLRLLLEAGIGTSVLLGHINDRLGCVAQT